MYHLVHEPYSVQPIGWVLQTRKLLVFSWKTTILAWKAFHAFWLIIMERLCSEQFSFTSILPTDKEALSLNFVDFYNLEEGICSRIPRFNLPSCTKHNWGWGRLVTKRKTRKGNSEWGLLNPQNWEGIRKYSLKGNMLYIHNVMQICGLKGPHSCNTII